jgi:hypothetical protein
MQTIKGECEQTYPGAVNPFPQGGGAGPRIQISPMSKVHVDLGVDLRVAQLHGEGMVRTTWPRLLPHGNFPLKEWLIQLLKNVRRRFTLVRPSHCN